MAGYTRQDTANNIANGNVIDADDFDAEYNAIESAFNASTGHTHDGTTGNGAPIEKVGPSQDLVVSATKVEAKQTNTLDLGSSGVQFKDGFFGGTLNTYILSVDETTTLTGAVTASSTLDVTGATGIDGDFDINTNKFTVASASGNTAIAGTLAVTGASTLTGDVTASGAMNITGNTGVDGNFDINTDKFTVASATGNTAVAGTLAVTGTSAFTGEITASGGVTGDLTGNADTATTWETARSITLTGDVTGTVSGVNGGSDVSITTTVEPNSVALGTDTTGSYVGSLVAGTGVTLTNNSGEGATPTIAIGQAVGTSSNVTFNDVVVSGDLTVSGTTTTVNTETINLADNVITLNSNAAGTPTQNGGIEVERGSETNKTLVWNETDDKWTVGSETFVAGTFEGALTGNVTGNADTATTLQTARTISLTGDVSGSVSFNGGSNVSITATVADDSHNHTISNVDGLQTALDNKAALAGSSSQDFSAQTLNATTVDLGDWTITESGTTLLFKIGSTTYMRLDSSGNLTVRGDVTAKDTSI